jgi:uncharacterized glyoxalase superfamily protein PhnB
MSQSIFPTFRYRDADAALEFLKAAFGFEEKEVHRGDDGKIVHAELRLGDNLVMFGTAPAEGAEDSFPLQAGVGSVYVVVGDTDAHHDRAVRAGAEIVRELTDQDYGSREYSARDSEGVLWSFGTYDPFAPEG